MILPLLIASTILGTSISIFLIYNAYKNRNVNQANKVLSLFLIKKLPKRVLTHKNIKIPFRFFLEALALLIVSVILLFLILNNKTSVLTVLVDNSLSMSAVDDSNKSRFEKASTSILTELQNWQNINIVTTCSQELDGSRENLTRAEASEYLSKVKAINCEDGLQENLLGTIKKFPSDKLILATDKNIVNTNAEVKIISDSFVSSRNISLNDILCTKTSNIYDCNLYYSYSGNGNATFKYRLKNKNDNKSIFDTNIQANSGNLQQANFQIPESSIVSSLVDSYILEIYSLSIKDSISLDNIIPVRFNETKDVIELISDLNEVELDTIKRSLEIALKSSISITKEANSSKASLKIFYKTAFPKEVTSNTIVILPNQSNENIKVNPPVQNPKITSWDIYSSITRYVNYTNFNIGNSLVFDPPSWGNLLIMSEKGPIALSGVINNFKVITYGFDLLPFEGSKNTAASILLLNSLSNLYNGKNSLENGALQISTSLEESETFTQTELTIPELKEVKLSTPKNAFNKNLILSLLLLVILVLLLDLLLVIILRREV